MPCAVVFFNRDAFVVASTPSLVNQLVKNPPKMQETWVRSQGWEDSLGREDPLEKGKDTHTSILARRMPWPV